MIEPPSAESSDDAADPISGGVESSHSYGSPLYAPFLGLRKDGSLPSCSTWPTSGAPHERDRVFAAIGLSIALSQRILQ